MVQIRVPNGCGEELKSLVTACCQCKRFRSPDGEWISPERFLKAHLDVLISHGHCPECGERLRAAFSIQGDTANRES